MRFVAISDTHGAHRELEIPRGDVLLHAGDICDQGNRTHVADFIEWFAEQEFQHKIFISGNHDIDMVKNESLIPKRLPKSIVFLNGNKHQVGRHNIWGSPVEELGRPPYWELLPKQVDILLTHRPPFEILDLAPDGRPKGSRELAQKVKAMQPKVHLFGHIHVSYGTFNDGTTQFINASNYETSVQKIIRPAVVFDLD